jgi:hypothetical protein
VTDDFRFDKTLQRQLRLRRDDEVRKFAGHEGDEHSVALCVGRRDVGEERQIAGHRHIDTARERHYKSRNNPESRGRSVRFVEASVQIPAAPPRRPMYTRMLPFFRVHIVSAMWTANQAGRGFIPEG